MNPDQLVKVFDVLDSGYRDWEGPAFGLIFIAIGLLTALWPKIVKRTGLPLFDFNRRARALARYGMLGLAIFLTSIAFAVTFWQYSRHKAVAEAGGCRLVQGPVQQFVSGPKGESFSVSGVSFSYAGRRRPNLLVFRPAVRRGFVIWSSYRAQRNGGPVASSVGRLPA